MEIGEDKSVKIQSKEDEDKKVEDVEIGGT